MTLKVEVAEAFCSALYSMPFVEFLGEQDGVPFAGLEGPQPAWHGWWHVGEKPKDMRVTVIRPEKAEFVAVKVEWKNYFADARNPLRGEQTFTVDTYAMQKEDLQRATEAVTVKVLELYKQVLSEDGVAGKIADLVESGEDGEEQSEE